MKEFKWEEDVFNLTFGKVHNKDKTPIVALKQGNEIPCIPKSGDFFYFAHSR